MNCARTHRGLTLIELLAAAVILSAMAAAIVSVQRDAVSAARRARLADGAAEALARWELTAAEQREGWAWTDAAGAVWRLRTEPVADRERLEAEFALDAFIDWELLVVERAPTPGAAFSEAMRLHRAVETRPEHTDDRSGVRGKGGTE